MMIAAFSKTYSGSCICIIINILICYRDFFPLSEFTSFCLCEFVQKLLL